MCTHIYPHRYMSCRHLRFALHAQLPATRRKELNSYCKHTYSSQLNHRSRNRIACEDQTMTTAAAAATDSSISGISVWWDHVTWTVKKKRWWCTRKILYTFTNTSYSPWMLVIPRAGPRFLCLSFSLSLPLCRIFICSVFRLHAVAAAAAHFPILGY